MTGANVYRFDYGVGHTLSAITDRAGQVTQIERDATGTPTAIVGPFGQRTALSLDANGYLQEIRDPEGNSTTMTYQNGLLTSMTNGRGETSTMSYDALGRLALDADAAGGYQQLSQSGDYTDWSVSRSTALGRTTTYQTQILPDSVGVSRTVTTPDLLQQTSADTPEFLKQNSLADGTQISVAKNSDARFGLVSPIESRTTVLPSGLTSVEANARQFTSLNPNDPLDFLAMASTRVLNGRTWTTNYVKSSRTFTDVTPVGRTTTRIIDTLGRTTRTQVTGLARMDYQYDTNGRLLRTIQGTGTLARTTDYGYVPSGSSAGYLQSITDALTVPTTYGRDALGRTLIETRAGATTGFTWDPVSNLATVTPPGRPTHGMTYTPVDLLETYAPPPAGLPAASTSYTYDLDRMLRTETRPDGVQIVRTPDSAGRLDTVQIPGGMLDYAYYPPGTPSGAGKTSDILGPYGTNLHFTYDGMLTTQTTWSGNVTGSVAWQYNTDFNKILETVTGASGTAQTVFGYDNDQLLTCASPVSCAARPRPMRSGSRGARRMASSRGSRSATRRRRCRTTPSASSRGRRRSTRRRRSPTSRTTLRASSGTSSGGSCRRRRCWGHEGLPVHVRRAAAADGRDDQRGAR